MPFGVARRICWRSMKHTTAEAGWQCRVDGPRCASGSLWAIGGRSAWTSRRWQQAQRRRQPNHDIERPSHALPEDWERYVGYRKLAGRTGPPRSSFREAVFLPNLVPSTVFELPETRANRHARSAVARSDKRSPGFADTSPGFADTWCRWDARIMQPQKLKRDETALSLRCTEPITANWRPLGLPVCLEPKDASQREEGV
jgi:hypothetical protein